MSLFRPGRGEIRSMGWFGTGADGPSGRTITADNAPRLAPVFAALRHIVDFGSTLPVDAYRKNTDGTRTMAPTPQLFSQLDDPGGPGVVSWLGQAFYGIANGNAVGWITQTDGFGFPTRVSWLHWSQWAFDEMTKQWTVFGQPVLASQLLHIPWIVPPGRTLGLSPIEHYATIVRAGLSAQEYADVKRGGGLPPAIVKNIEKTLAPEVISAAKERVVTSFAKGEPFVTGKDWDLTVMSIPPNHAQFIETLKLSANQIAAIYGIDPREIGGSAAESLTYTNDESRALNRAGNMRPYLERFERAISRYLPQKQFIRLNVDATIRTDIKTRTEVIGAKLADGRLSVNEARTLEDDPPVTGGDFHNVPAPKADPTNRGDTP